MNRPRCIVFIALSASIALCGPLAPGMSAFSRTAIDGDSEWRTDANGIKLASSRISDPASRITGGYDEVGNLKSVVYPNNVKHQYTYTALNRLELLIDRSPTNSIINCWRYRATPAGQRTWVEEFDKRTAWYTYDSLGRLKTETVTGSIKDNKNGTVTYGYDNVGNRLSRVSALPGVTNQSFGYDWNDRLNGDQYDNNGNTKSAPVSQPSAINPQQLLGTDDYDSENRLVQRSGTLNSQLSTLNSQLHIRWRWQPRQ